MDCITEYKGCYNKLITEVFDMSKFAAYTTVPSYDRLVEVLQVYLNRYDGDTLDAMPFFINAAEKTILRNLRMPSMEKIVSFTVSELGNPEEGFVALPLDYLEMKFVWVDGVTLQRVTFDQLIDSDNKTSRYERTEFDRPIWAINGSRMYVRGVESTKPIKMTYYADVIEVSESTGSNVLLDLVPDAFLFLAVAEGFRFLMEEAKSDYWETQGMKRLNQIKLQVEEAEFSGSPLVIRPM